MKDEVLRREKQKPTFVQERERRERVYKMGLEVFFSACATKLVATN